MVIWFRNRKSSQNYQFYLYVNEHMDNYVIEFTTKKSQ